jgi:hypothetical protein
VQQAVVLQLDAGAALAVDVDEAEHLGGEGAGGVAAHGVAEHPDAGQAQPRHGVAPLGGHPPRQVHPGLRRGQPAAQLVHGPRQQRGQPAGGGLAVADQARLGVDRPRVDRQGEVVEVAVHDAAAVGGQLDGAQALPGRRLVERGGVDHLQDDQPAGDGEEREQGGAEHHQQALAAVAAARATAAAAAAAPPTAGGAASARHPLPLPSVPWMRCRPPAAASGLPDRAAAAPPRAATSRPGGGPCRQVRRSPGDQGRGLRTTLVQLSSVQRFTAGLPTRCASPAGWFQVGRARGPGKGAPERAVMAGPGRA